jgi:hypothetical protein
VRYDGLFRQASVRLGLLSPLVRVRHGISKRGGARGRNNEHPGGHAEERPELRRTERFCSFLVGRKGLIEWE